MAYADEEAGTTVVPQLHEFLPKVHQELFEGHKGAHRPYWTRALEVGPPEQDRAFVKLKHRMVEDVILAIPNETDPFMVEADASEGAIGAVLSQKQNGKWRPVAFMSKSLSATERNYKIYDKELLAIMLALDEWRHYLMGATVDVEIWTDHQNLQYFRQPQKLNRRQVRWVTELAEYHFVLITSQAH